MDGSAVDLCLEHRRHSAPRELSSPPIPDDLLLDIFRRIPSSADLVRASAACVSFRRLIADRSFLRQYRKLHAPPLLGFLDIDKVFHPVEPPHPSAPAASAAALTADFSFSFLPAPASDWILQDIRDGRVLLDRPCQHGTHVFKDMVVCDPLHRRYLLLPPITYDLANSVEVPPPPPWTKKQYGCEIFLVSSSDGDGAVAADETSFRVVWMTQCITRLVAFVFSSNTRQWRAIPSQRWSDLFASLLPFKMTSLFYSRQYVYGCFYWVIYYREESKLLVLDTKTLEFSIAEPPPETNSCYALAMVETGHGRPGMFMRADSGPDLSYFISQNDGGSSSHWQKVKTISLGSGTSLICNMGKYLLLYQRQSSQVEAGCFTLDIESFQLEKVCALGPNIYKLQGYSNFPPSLLSSPTVSSGIQENAEKAIAEEDKVVLPAEAHSHHDQNTADTSAGGQASVWIGDGAD